MKKYRSQRNAGLTLTEMLIVVSIVVTMSALSIPILSQSGFFTSDRSRAAARDLYQMLRATRLYATTNNVETALVYRTRMVYETANDDVYPVDVTPIIDGYAICRKLSEDELVALDAYFTGISFAGRDDIYIPIEESNGRFRDMPDSMGVLSDVFQFSVADFTNNNGLEPVYVVDPFANAPAAEASPFMLPTAHIYDTFLTDGMSNDGDAAIDEPDEAERLHFDLGDGDISTAGVQAAIVPQELDNGDFSSIHAFPAHRFAITGEVITQTAQQRLEMRVGLSPEELAQDRFIADPLAFDPAVEFENNFPYTTDDMADPTDAEIFQIRFHRLDPAGDAEGDPMDQYYFYDPRRPDRNVGDNAFDGDWLIESVYSVVLYASTGRVKVDSDG